MCTSILKKKHASLINVLEDKWCEALNDDINDDILLESFENAKKFATSVYHYHNQYKLIHIKPINNQLLKIMNIVDSEVCLFCKDHMETVEHIYFNCNNTKTCGMTHLHG